MVKCIKIKFRGDMNEKNTLVTSINIDFTFMHILH